VVKRYKKDNMIAVLISVGFGAGWSTFNKQYEEEMLYDPFIVDILLQRSKYGENINNIILEYVNLKYPGAYTSGIDGLEITFLKKGTQFNVAEYDGHEQIVIKDQVPWLTA